MGPSWIKIRHPRPPQQTATIAKFEFTVADPKHVQGRMDVAPPSPPMVVMSLALKTVVNPASQLHEVCPLCPPVCHESVWARVKTRSEKRRGTSSQRYT